MLAFADPKATPPSAKKPKLPKLDDGDPRDIWRKFFAEQKPQPAELAETVRWLHQQRKHEHTIACLETANQQAVVGKPTASLGRVGALDSRSRAK